MPAIVEKDNQLIQHCRASKYKTGPLVGMRVPLYDYLEEEPIGVIRSAHYWSHACSYPHDV